jgi:hypothetical protein
MHLFPDLTAGKVGPSPVQILCPKFKPCGPTQRLLWLLSLFPFHKLLYLLSFITQPRYSLGTQGALLTHILSVSTTIILKTFLQLPLTWPIQAQC